DDDQEVALAEHGRAITQLARVVDLDRQTRELVQEELADERGVPSGAAGAERQALDALEPRRDRFELGELHVAGFEPDSPAQRIDQSLRLFVNLLQQEVLVAALLSGDSVPGDAPRSARARSSVEVEQRDRISRHLG